MAAITISPERNYCGAPDDRLSALAGTEYHEIDVFGTGYELRLATRKYRLSCRQRYIRSFSLHRLAAWLPPGRRPH